MVADKVLLDLFLKEREIEHIRGFCDITSGAIIGKNLDMIVGNGVHILFLCGRAEEIRNLFLTNAKTSADAFGNLTLIFSAKGLG